MVLIIPNNYRIISLTVVTIVVSIQSCMWLSLGSNPSDPEPELLDLVIVTMLTYKGELDRYRFMILSLNNIQSFPVS